VHLGCATDERRVPVRDLLLFLEEAMRLEDMEKVRELKQLAMSQTRALKDPETYRKFLDCASLAYPRYRSLQNLALIFSQCPHATDVGALGNYWIPRNRTKKKYEPGIEIIVPCYKQNQDGKKIKTGEIAVSVYDISQTEDDPVPEDLRRVMKISDLYVLFMQFLQDHGYDVIEAELSEGHSSIDAKTVWVEIRDDELVKLTNLIKEYSHVIHGHLHILHMAACTRVLEFQAVSTAYTVCRKLGLELPENPFSSMSGWVQRLREDIFVKALELSLAIAFQIHRNFADYAGLEHNDLAEGADERQVA